MHDAVSGALRGYAVADPIEHVEGALERLGVEAPPTEVGRFERIERRWGSTSGGADPPRRVRENLRRKRA